MSTKPTIARRAFLAGSLAAVLQGKRDAYGGWPGMRFEASGFFRLEKKDRWWMVTPQGNAFLGFGLNHAMLPLLTRPECVEHWAKEFGVEDRSDRSQFIPGYRKKLRADLQALGMNHLGVHSSTRELPPGFAAYLHTVRFVDICHYMTPSESDFHDVFSHEFEARCDRVAQTEVLPRKDDAWLIGYFMTDGPIFTDLDAGPRPNNIYGAARPGLPTWPRVLRNLGAQSPGKRAYVALMRERYGGEIARFNGAYATAFESWEALERATRWRPDTDRSNAHEAADNLAFLARVVDRYYTVAVAAIRKYDRNHMIVGDKLNANTDPQDALVKLAGRHMDLVFYQMYGHWEEQKPLLDRWSRLTGRPMFNGDSSYALPYKEMPNPYGPHCRDQQERARRFREFGENAFARPDFVGWSWCGWIDGLSSHQKEKQHSGVQDPWGRCYQPLTGAMASFSARMYDVARAGKP
jgi:hypothetical protein